MARLKALEQGWISRQGPGETFRAGSPRCALSPGEEIICVFMMATVMGTNDLRPMATRSADGGLTWSDPEPLWPKLAGDWSIFVSVSRSGDGDLFVFGDRTRIDVPGESSWCPQTQGIKQNELVWSRSSDGGRTWIDPRVIPMPVPGSAETPSPMCIMRNGRWLCPYSPYNTFDATLKVDRSRVLIVYSDDRGETWRHTAMLRFDEPESGGAMAWVTELADGRLLGAGWHLDLRDRREYPNAYAISQDGASWSPTRSTGIMGQSVGLAALGDGRALMAYNQRKHGEIGVHLAVARPTEDDFGIEADQVVWRAASATQTDTSGDHSQWTDFSFGAPSIVPLPDDTLLVTLWTCQPTEAGIQYIRLRMTD